MVAWGITDALIVFCVFPPSILRFIFIAVTFLEHWWNLITFSCKINLVQQKIYPDIIYFLFNVSNDPREHKTKNTKHLRFMHRVDQGVFDTLSPTCPRWVCITETTGILTWEINPVLNLDLPHVTVCRTKYFTVSLMFKL